MNAELEMLAAARLLGSDVEAFMSSDIVPLRRYRSHCGIRSGF